MNNRATIVLLALAATAGCRAVVNYQSPLGPRYGGEPSSSAAVPTAGHLLRVVTYNADALGMAWVYCPAAVHPKRGADFGNAVLSRWPIIADGKLMLPHIGGLRHAQRIATAATVLVGPVAVRVYSAHLSTPSDIRPSKRRDQARAILADAAAYPLVIVAGDMNSHGIGKEFLASGFRWPTEHNGFTTAVFNWDHVFLKGFATPIDRPFTGIVRDTLGTSDHDPVWAVALLP